MISIFYLHEIQIFNPNSNEETMKITNNELKGNFVGCDLNYVTKFLPLENHVAINFCLFKHEHQLWVLILQTVVNRGNLAGNFCDSMNLISNEIITLLLS